MKCVKVCRLIITGIIFWMFFPYATEQVFSKEITPIMQSVMQGKTFTKISVNKRTDLSKCELIIKVRENELKAGNKIYLRVTFKNKSSHLVFIPALGGSKHRTIEIKDLQGKIVSPSEKGRERQSFPEMGSYGLREVAPGDEYQFQITISDLYELPVGKYSVAVLQTFLVKNENEDEKKITHVKSNSIKLVIK